jgi:hypothetical protein
LPRITNQQLQHLKDAHADGLLDRQIAERAGISLATTKRYRSQLGLETNSVTAQRGRLGERITAMYAAEAGLSVIWRTRDNETFDLLINGKRTDAKTSMMLAGSTWRFRLLEERTSFYGAYSYMKDLAADCEVVSFVCLFPDSREPEIYLMSSAHLPSSVRIRSGGSYEPSRDDWSLFTPNKIVA